MSKHTPGPWARDKYGSVVGPDGKDILFRSMSTLSASSDERMEMAEANTDLAASAPDLLEALEQAVTSMQDSGYPNSHVAVRAARQAISKAKGESA